MERELVAQPDEGRRLPVTRGTAGAKGAKGTRGVWKALRHDGDARYDAGVVAEDAKIHAIDHTGWARYALCGRGAIRYVVPIPFEQDGPDSCADCSAAAAAAAKAEAEAEER